MRFLPITFFCLVLLLVTGCATTSPKAPAMTFQPTGDPVTDGKARIQTVPPRDKVLWQYQTALLALRKNRYVDAKELLDDALLTIGNIYGKDKSAKKARRLFSEEAKKTFLGEPYERVMAYYYRGILYWMDGEPDNARACFRSAQLQDSDTEQKEYASDYVLLDYLDGLATAKLAGDGSDSLKRALTNARLEKPAPYDAKANTLFFIEFGKGPTKYASGEFSEQLRFHPGSSIAKSARIKVGDKAVTVGAMDDLSYQATTRGGRVMDHVLANKAVFKSTTDTVGNVALLSGLVVASNRDTQEAGLGLLAFGVLTKVVAATTTPAADTRTWHGLPLYLSFCNMDLPPGQHTAYVEFLDAAGKSLPSMAKTVHFTISPGRDAVIFVSDQS